MTTKEYYKCICAGDQVRQNLIALRDSLKEEKERREFAYLLGGDFSKLIALLEDEDPKVRRNAAAILGKMESEDLLPVLFDAYEKETTRFIRADYLKAMSGMDYRPLLGALKERLARFREAEALPEERKHIQEEIRVLQGMVLRFEKREPHRFVGWQEPVDVVLVTNRCLREVTAHQVKTGLVSMLAGGIRIRQALVGELRTIRTFSEMLFPVITKAAAEKDAGKSVGADGIETAQAAGKAPSGETSTEPAAQSSDRLSAQQGGRTSAEQEDRPNGGLSALQDGKTAAEQEDRLNSGLSAQQAAQLGAGLAAPVLALARKLHQGDGAYLFRIELKSRMEPERKGVLLRRISDAVEQASGGELINSVSGYELEIRLLERKNGAFLPMVKFYTISDTRFAYRREVIASSIAPVNAALVAEVARPYLKEGAQVLDPFCGVGTMLVERDRAVKAGIMYGIDLFGEAVEKARRNTQCAGCQVYYVNKDFFEFEHGYRFDEIITDLPQVTANHPSQEIRGLYRDFFVAADRHLQGEALLVLYTTEPQFVLDAVKERREYKVIEKHTVNEKNGTSIFIIRRQA